MIVREFYMEREDGVKLFRTYSDERRKIRKVGTDEVYSEAVDIEGKDYVYKETDEYVEQLNKEQYGRD